MSIAASSYSIVICDFCDETIKICNYNFHLTGHANEIQCGEKILPHPLSRVPRLPVRAPSLPRRPAPHRTVCAILSETILHIQWTYVGLAGRFMVQELLYTVKLYG